MTVRDRPIRTRTKPRRALRTCLLLALTLQLSTATAQNESEPAHPLNGGPMVPGAQTMPPPDHAPSQWHTFADTTLRFAIDVPDTHVVAYGGGSFAVRTFHEGQPTVQDMTLTFFEGATVEDLLARSLHEGAEVREILLGPGTPGLVVDVAYEGMDGDTYRRSSYLVPGRGGVMRIMRHESFAWSPFDDVARSFRWWTPASRRNADE